jgi:hypothetical protein
VLRASVVSSSKAPEFCLLTAYTTPVFFCVIWLLQLPPGGILADTMGLGKTVQAILLITGCMRGPSPAMDRAAAAAQQLGLELGGSLILVPEGLLGQWVGELLLKCGGDPRMVVCEFTGGRTWLCGQWT